MNFKNVNKILYLYYSQFKLGNPNVVSCIVMNIDYIIVNLPYFSDIDVVLEFILSDNRQLRHALRDYVEVILRMLSYKKEWDKYKVDKVKIEKLREEKLKNSKKGSSKDKDNKDKASFNDLDVVSKNKVVLWKYFLKGLTAKKLMTSWLQLQEEEGEFNASHLNEEEKVYDTVFRILLTHYDFLKEKIILSLTGDHLKDTLKNIGIDSSKAFFYRLLCRRSNPSLFPILSLLEGVNPCELLLSQEKYYELLTLLETERFAWEEARERSPETVKGSVYLWDELYELRKRLLKTFLSHESFYVWKPVYTILELLYCVKKDGEIEVYDLISLEDKSFLKTKEEDRCSKDRCSKDRCSKDRCSKECVGYDSKDNSGKDDSKECIGYDGKDVNGSPIVHTSPPSTSIPSLSPLSLYIQNEEKKENLSLNFPLRQEEIKPPPVFPFKQEEIKAPPPPERYKSIFLPPLKMKFYVRLLCTPLEYSLHHIHASTLSFRFIRLFFENPEDGFYAECLSRFLRASLENEKYTGFLKEAGFVEGLSRAILRNVAASYEGRPKTEAIFPYAVQLGLLAGPYKFKDGDLLTAARLSQRIIEADLLAYNDDKALDDYLEDCLNDLLVRYACNIVIDRMPVLSAFLSRDHHPNSSVEHAETKEEKKMRLSGGMQDTL